LLVFVFVESSYGEGTTYDEGTNGSLDFLADMPKRLLFFVARRSPP
jgi:hypothetical protein